MQHLYLGHWFVRVEQTLRIVLYTKVHDQRRRKEQFPNWEAVTKQLQACQEKMVPKVCHAGSYNAQ
jgi:hypothetical protein